MPLSELFLIKKYAECQPQDEWDKVPLYTRGIYALLQHDKQTGDYNVVYVGMAAGKKGGMRSRLRTHAQRKPKHWTHFSIYEVWDNIPESVVRELEGLFRHIYRSDARSNPLNLQRRFKKFKSVQVERMADWKKK